MGLCDFAVSKLQFYPFGRQNFQNYSGLVSESIRTACIAQMLSVAIDRMASWYVSVLGMPCPLALQTAQPIEITFGGKLIFTLQTM